jgi:hypothetical protein
MKSVCFLALLATALVAADAGGLTKEVLKKGDCSTVAKTGDSVKVSSLHGTYLAGKETAISCDHCHIFFFLSKCLGDHLRKRA